MTVPSLPARGSSDWYDHYTALDTEARKVVDKLDTATASAAYVPKVFAATDTAGEGVLLKTNGTYTVETTAGLHLINLNIKNTLTTSPDGKAMYGLFIVCDTDVVDSGAGIAVVNNGKSDNIYLAVAGKPGAEASTPTGVGVDVNRGQLNVVTGRGGENSTANKGYGIQVWDWSVTDQGLGGPTGLFLRKHVNYGTSHKLAYLRGNRNLLWLETISNDASYSASAVVIQLADAAVGGNKWQVLADGKHVFANSVGLDFTGAAGNPAKVYSSGSSWLHLVGGAAGVRVVANDNATVNLAISDGGTIVPRDGAALNTAGQATGFRVGSSPTDKIGFWGAGPVGRLDVTGSRGANVALASLLVALHSAGLITDSTTA